MSNTHDYVIVTDSGCDLTLEQRESMELDLVPLNAFMKDTPTQPCTLVGADFYNALRDGHIACTSAANLSTFREIYIRILNQGKDILFLSFSSALSCMYATARLTAEELATEYPKRKIITVDSLSASMGQGLLLYYAVQKKREGASIEELEAYLLENRLHLIHWFTVDDLMFLKRGGRLSSLSAVAGTLLGIKPVMHVSDEGKLIAKAKVRGRKNALLALAKHFADEVYDPTQQVYISHGDDIEAANFLRDTIMKEYGATNVIIGDVGPVIGAHSGPGTIALFYMGKGREL